MGEEKKYTCDRCKRTWNEGNKPRFRTIEQKEQSHLSGNYKIKRELCPKCYESFLHFMDGAFVTHGTNIRFWTKEG